MRPGNVISRCARGFTLPEALLASAVLATVVIAVGQAVVAGQMQGYAGAHDRRAILVAEDLLERVLALPYADPDGLSTSGPEADEAGFQTFDNSDDYDGYAEEAGALLDGAGQPYLVEGYETFRRNVTVTYETINIPGLAAAHPGLMVRVLVEDGSGRGWRLERFVPDPTGL